MTHYTPAAAVAAVPLFTLEAIIIALAERNRFETARDASECAYYARWIRGGNHLSRRFVGKARALVVRCIAFEQNVIQVIPATPATPATCASLAFVLPSDFSGARCD